MHAYKERLMIRMSSDMYQDLLYESEVSGETVSNIVRRAIMKRTKYPTSMYYKEP